MLTHQQVKVGSGSMHVVSSGTPHESAVLFVHGWPEDWSAFEKLLELAGAHTYALAIDQPGIGLSAMPNIPGTKRAIADCIHELIGLLHIQRLTLVGHDAGGMVVFPYLCRYHQELERAVIMNVVVPGLKPWDEVLRNPYIWHFGFHSVPDLPEKLVSGKQREYFDYFFNTITADPKHITDEARYRYAQAYASPSALTTGFNWYRAFQQDAKDNREGIAGQQRIETPLLYLRGDHEYGKIDDYVAGFKEANIANIQSAIIPNSGHFAPEEQPEAIWEKIAAFMEL